VSSAVDFRNVSRNSSARNLDNWTQSKHTYRISHFEFHIP